MASERVALLVLKDPLTADVTVKDFGFLAPLMDIHMCSASMTTITPRGLR
jgi:hypothetical protein